MACTRRSLTSSFTRLSRRFHPSVAHALHDGRDGGEPSRIPPIHTVQFPPLALSFSRSGPAFGSPLRDVRLPLPLGVDPFPRSYSSSAEEGSDEVEYIKDVAEVLMDTTVDAAAVASTVVLAPFPGEVASAAAGSYLPVAALQFLIGGVHSFTGLNWWASIALTTLLIRGATIPLMLNQMRATVKLNMMRPELEEVNQHLRNSMDPEEGRKRFQEIFQKHGVKPLTPLKGLLIQGPVFISFFLAISNMVEKVPSFKAGGTLWFTDLTTPDPLYLLPVLMSLTFLATVELNMQEGMEGNPFLNTMKKVSRVFGLMTIPLTANFPKALFCYWITSNIFSLTYGFVIKRAPVKKFLNIPDIVPQPTNPAPHKSTAPTSAPAPTKESEQSKPPER